DLARYDCVFLCDVAELFADDVRRLTDLVRRGGGLVVCLGPNVKRENYNQELFQDGNGLLPAALVGLEAATEGYEFRFAGDDAAFNQPPLKEFSRETYKNTLLAARFRSFYQVAEPSAGVKPRRVLAFAPVKVPGRAGRAAGKVPSGGAAVLEWHP